VCVLVDGKRVGSMRFVQLVVARLVFAVRSIGVVQADGDEELCITLFPTLAA